MSKKKRSSVGVTIVLILVFLVGIGLLIYPTLSDYVNKLHQSRAIAGYAEAVAKYTEDELNAIWESAVRYNEELYSHGTWSIELETDEEIAKYEAELNLEGDGMMGYIDIDSIDVHLAIYHGSSDAVLSKNIGHLEGSALPVGGEGTHSVLSGHRGLTSARLFTDIDLLSEGDTFTLHVLDRTLTYEVDQILTVLPYEIDALAPVSGMDYCTLITCTPYGVNSHRLLVRGHRIENHVVETIEAAETEAYAQEDIDKIPLAVKIAGIALIILILILLYRLIKRKKH